MLIKSKKFSIAIFTIFYLINTQNLNCASFNDDVRDQVEQAIEDILENEGINKYRIPKSFKSDLRKTIEDTTTLLKRFLKKMKSVVLSHDLDKFIRKAIDDRLYNYNLTTNSIPSSLMSEFNSKKRSIKDRLKDLMRYNNNEYVTKEEIKNVVESRLDYSFIKKIKNNNESSWNLFDSLTNAWNNLANTVGSNSNNNNSTSQSTNNYSPNYNSSNSSSSSNFQIYYDPKCTVCQEDFYGEERVGVLNCGHVFHPECIKEWLKHSKTCPLCRKQNAYLAKIYDSKEKVPGYYPSGDDYVEYTQPSNNNQSQPQIEIFHSNECSICFDDYSIERIALLSCGHTFHPDCINEWLSSQNTCPLCRKEGVTVVGIYDDESEF